MSGAAMADPRITRLDAAGFEARLDALAEILHATVADCASVGFVEPFTREDSRAFWRDGVGPALRRGTRVLLIAETGGALTGTVQLDLDMMPNQAHRGVVAKLLVHPEHRRRGIARALMRAIEGEAWARGRSLVTLDTRTGDDAEPLYRALGYQAAGTIPGFALAPGRDRLDPTTYMYKMLASADSI